MNAHQKTIDPLDPEYLGFVSASTVLKAYDDFEVFRKVMRPNMLWNWWIRDAAAALQQFYVDLIAGRRPRLVIMAPPQHGKSWSVTDFIAWIAGKMPDGKTIFASYADDLGIRTNRAIERMLKSPRYQMVFPDLHIDEVGWQCHTSLIEYVGYTGSFRNTTVKGTITGFELNLGVVDDPIKGRAEAASKVVRDATSSLVHRRLFAMPPPMRASPPTVIW
jgi:hypothetical protein